MFSLVGENRVETEKVRLKIGKLCKREVIVTPGEN